MTKIFVLGATGFLGGTVLEKLISQHPNLEITALVRSAEKAKIVTDAYPNIRTVIGNLDSFDIISEESSKADIVFSAADADLEPQIRAVYDGMSKNTNISYLIHTSGTGILGDPTMKHAGQKVQSSLSDKLWDDIADIDGINSLPDNHAHRNVDKIVQSPPSDSIRFAIVAPPLIYGTGTGPSNRRSIQIPSLIGSILKVKEAFAVAPGENTWSNVHILDLADVYLHIFNEALKPNGGDIVSWGNQAYYFAENGTHYFADISREIGKHAHAKGLIPSPELKLYDKEKVAEINPAGLGLWATNSLSKASRARRDFGWSPKHTYDNLIESVEAEVEYASKKL